jgi:ketosteroid isomerase-like protein
MAEMSDVDEFLSAVLPRQRQAEVAILNGDAEPRKMLWSHNDPVTILGAAKNVAGWTEVESTFDWLGSNFSNGTAYELEVIAAGVSGDLGYIAAYEHSTMSVGGAAPAPLTLRVTLIFRREDGEWKEVHRHADAGVSQEMLGRFK